MPICDGNKHSERQVRYFAASMVVALGLLQFVYLPFFGNINDTAKQFVLVFLTLGGSFCFLKKNQSLHLPKVSWLLGLLLVFLFISSFSAFHPYDAFVGVACTGIAVMLLILVFNVSISSPSFPDYLLGCILFSGVFASTIGLYQYVHFRLIGPDYSTYSTMEGMLLPYLIPPMHNIRINGIYGHSNFFALFLAVCLIAFFCHYIHFRRPITTPVLSTLRFVPVVLVAVVFFLTHSRSGILALSASVAVLFYLVIKKRYPLESPAAKRELWLLGGSLLVAFLLFKLIINPQILTAFTDSSPVAQISSVQASQPVLTRSETLSSHNVEARLVHYLTAILIFLDHPLLGIGLDNLKSYLAEYQLKALGILRFEYEALEYTRWTHNEYLQILCEGGIVPAIVVGIFIVLFFFSFYRKLISVPTKNPYLLYSHLFLIPFLIQFCFSWTLRYPPLQALFCVFVGFLFSFHGKWQVKLPARIRISLNTMFLGAFLIGGLLVKQEIQTVQVFAQLRENSYDDASLKEFEALVANPYNEYYGLRRVVPRLAGLAKQDMDTELAVRVLPLAKRIVEIEGAYTGWFNLSLLYFVAGMHDEAVDAVKMAIDRRPIYNPAWVWLHYLNIVKASEKSNRPMSDFFPKMQTKAGEI